MHGPAGLPTRLGPTFPIFFRPSATARSRSSLSRGSLLPALPATEGTSVPIPTIFWFPFSHCAYPERNGGPAGCPREAARTPCDDDPGWIYPSGGTSWFAISSASYVEDSVPPLVCRTIVGFEPALDGLSFAAVSTPREPVHNSQMRPSPSRVDGWRRSISQSATVPVGTNGIVGSERRRLFRGPLEPFRYIRGLLRRSLVPDYPTLHAEVRRRT